MDNVPGMSSKENVEKLADPIPDNERFVDFQYVELKDLGKHFLTIVSASLAFIATFADKLLDISHATPLQKWLLKGALGVLMFSIITVGIGIYYNYRAGSRAKGSIIRKDENRPFQHFVRLTYRLYLLGGPSFILALVLLGLIAILRIK